MEVHRNASPASAKGPVEHFTGTVRIDPLFQCSVPARASGAYVTFELRTERLAHAALGQTLIVTFGRGLHQRWGGPVEAIGPDDVVTVGPSEKRWHGASSKSPMTHIAIHESLDGKNVEWLKKMSDDQYQEGGEP